MPRKRSQKNDIELSQMDADHLKVLHAARQQDVVAIFNLIQEGVNVEQCNSNGESPIYALAKNGEHDAVNFLHRHRSHDELSKMLELNPADAKSIEAEISNNMISALSRVMPPSQASIMAHEQSQEIARKLRNDYKLFVMQSRYGLRQDSLELIAGYAHGGHKDKVIAEIKHHFVERDFTAGLLYKAAMNGYIRRLHLNGQEPTELQQQQIQNYKKEILDAIMSPQDSLYRDLISRSFELYEDDVKSCAKHGDIASVNKLISNESDAKKRLKMKMKAAHGYGLCGNMPAILALLNKTTKCEADEILYSALHGHYNGHYFLYEPVLLNVIESIPERYRSTVVDRILMNSDFVQQRSNYDLDFRIDNEIGNLLLRFASPEMREMYAPKPARIDRSLSTSSLFSSVSSASGSASSSYDLSSDDSSVARFSDDDLSDGEFRRAMP